MRILLVWAIIAATAIAVDSATPVDQLPAISDAVKQTAKVFNCYVDVVDQIARQEGVEHIWNPFRQIIRYRITGLSKCQTEPCLSREKKVIEDLTYDFGKTLYYAGYWNVVDRIKKEPIARCGKV